MIHFSPSKHSSIFDALHHPALGPECGPLLLSHNNISSQQWSWYLYPHLRWWAASVLVLIARPPEKMFKLAQWWILYIVSDENRFGHPRVNIICYGPNDDGMFCIQRVSYFRWRTMWNSPEEQWGLFSTKLDGKFVLRCHSSHYRRLYLT